MDADSGIAGIKGNNNTRKFYLGHADNTDQQFTFNRDFSIQPNNEINLAGGQTWTIADNKTVSLSANTMTNSGNWTITGGGTVAISKTFVNNGTITIDSGSALQVTDINALSKSIAWDDTMTENGAVGVNYVVTTGEGSITGDVKYTVNGTEKTASLTNASSFTDENAAYGVVQNSNLSDIVEGVNTNGANIIAIKEGVTLTQDSTGTFTNSQSLAGNGTYDLGAVKKNGANAKLGSGLTLDSSWTGTVSLSGGEASTSTAGATVNAVSVHSINFNSLGQAGSTVEIAAAGLYGYLSDSTTYNPDIKLTGDLTIQNGNSGFAHTFAGKVSGEGALNLIRELLKSQYDFISEFPKSRQCGIIGAWYRSLNCPPPYTCPICCNFEGM